MRRAAGRGRGRRRDAAARRARRRDRRRPDRRRRAGRRGGARPASSPPAATTSAPAGFAHDLYRETIYAGLAPARRLDLHHRVAHGAAAPARARRPGVRRPSWPATSPPRSRSPAPAPALRLGARRGRRGQRRFAFAEAAGHLARLRSAVADAGRRLPDAELVDAAHRRGRPAAARRRRGRGPRPARHRLGRGQPRPARPTCSARSALGLDRVGARFAMPRTDLIAVLDDGPRRRCDGTGTAGRGAGDRRAGPPAAALGAGRPAAGPAAGRAGGRDRPPPRRPGHAGQLPAGPARHAVDAGHRPPSGPRSPPRSPTLAGRAGDPERHAQALLLSATAQLENGSAAFRADASPSTPTSPSGCASPATTTCCAPGRPRSRCSTATSTTASGSAPRRPRSARRSATATPATSACRSGWRSSGPAATRPSCARPPPRRCAGGSARRRTRTPSRPGSSAGPATSTPPAASSTPCWRWTTGAPTARTCGRSSSARLAAAAIALGDRTLCRRLLDDLLPLADTCAVNGALVCFMGAHAHRVGLLHAALGDPEPARPMAATGRSTTHRRLGARAWEEESRQARAALDDTSVSPLRVDRRGRAGRPAPAPGRRHVAGELPRPDRLPARRQGPARPGRAAGPTRAPTCPRWTWPARRPVGACDRRRRPSRCSTAPRCVAYRRRLAELDDDLAAAATDADLARRQRAADERERLLAELRRATRPGGSSRAAGHHRRRTRPQGGHRPHPRRDPPHRRGSARPRRPPRPHDPDRHDLPLRGAGRGPLRVHSLTRVREWTCAAHRPGTAVQPHRDAARRCPGRVVRRPWPPARRRPACCGRSAPTEAESVLGRRELRFTAPPRLRLSEPDPARPAGRWPHRRSRPTRPTPGAYAGPGSPRPGWPSAPSWTGGPPRWPPIILRPLHHRQRGRLVAAMAEVERLLVASMVRDRPGGSAPAARPALRPSVLRRTRPPVRRRLRPGPEHHCRRPGVHRRRPACCCSPRCTASRSAASA